MNQDDNICILDMIIIKKYPYPAGPCSYELLHQRRNGIIAPLDADTAGILKRTGKI